MADTILFQMNHPSLPTGRVEGFRFLWAYYVNGYRPKRHCQRCFKGRRATNFCTPTARSGSVVEFDRMDRYPYLYICGVGIGPNEKLGEQNLHLPLKFKAGSDLPWKTYNGYSCEIRNAELVKVPALPENWNGLPRKHTRCRNFQFAVAVFGAENTQAARAISIAL